MPTAKSSCSISSMQLKSQLQCKLLASLRLTSRRGKRRGCAWHAATTSRRAPALISAVSISSLEDRTLSIKISLARSSGRLDLGWLGLEEVPQEVFELTELEDLVLAGNSLRTLPDDIAKLTSLKKLQLAGNSLTSLPSVFTTMDQLQEVWFHGNLLDRLPESIGNLTSLEKLSLSGNRLQSLPESLSRLRNLKELTIAGNLLQEVPESLGNLGNLQTLSLNGNRLTSIVPSLGRCQSLRFLHLQTNKITRVPEAILLLRSLEELNLSDNAIDILPSDWQGLEKCKEIWLYGNQLERLTPSLWTLPSLECLWLEGNPLDKEGLQTTLENLSSDSVLREIGLDEEEVNDSALPEHVQSRLRLGRSDTSGPGYFKVQPAGERLGNCLHYKGHASGENSEQSFGSKLLVVTFASAPGIPNWGGVLSKLAAEASAEEKKFDIFFVCDGGRNWYSGGDEGVKYWRTKIQAVTQSYEKVLMLGDSMGGTGALLFSDLATAIEVFTPQVKLSEASMRPGHSTQWLNTVEQNVVSSVASSQASIHCHCGTWDHDLNQARLLPQSKCELVVHDVDSHRLAITLNRHRRLLPIIRKAILKELGLYEPPNLLNLL